MSTTRPPTTGELEHQLYEATIAMLIRCGSRVSTDWSGRLQSSLDSYRAVMTSRRVGDKTELRNAFFAELKKLGSEFPLDPTNPQQHDEVKSLLTDVKYGFVGSRVWGETKSNPELNLAAWTCFLDRIAKLNVVVNSGGFEDDEILERIIRLALQHVDIVAERYDQGAGITVSSLSQRMPSREERMRLVPKWTEHGEAKIQLFSKALERLWSAKH